MSDDSQDADESEPFDDLDDEFSLDKLSKAYADVIRKRSADGEQSDTDKDDSGGAKKPGRTSAKESSASPPPKKSKRKSPPTPSQADDNRCLLYTSPSPRDRTRSRMPSSA